MVQFYDEEESVKMLFSPEWKDREHALYLLEQKCYSKEKS